MCSALAWRRVAHDCRLNRAINRKAVALYDFDSTPPETDIALKEGAEVGTSREVLHETSIGWVRGRMHSKEKKACVRARD